MKIKADRDVCIGAGNCVLAAENVFDQDDDAIVVVLEESPQDEDAESARNAVGSCPSGALSIEET
ncbi:ferredoxin [Actinomycetospora sp. TBRC 11914]|uniref:ferredoxin n=1 Tax=Actinomycetospora sp. TBRC 11914 TaxID=2729387 RepID=UPI00145D49CD|nr:(4Fe-4S)-binding protein [Actinomycetospora sp. TBRC 11914]NMO91376.1 ferredoxin [Actinomycetospora sp. TBRC 11914]